MKRLAIAGLLIMGGFHAAAQEMNEQALGRTESTVAWDLRCFPNPTSDLLIVKSSREIKSIDFYDLNGNNLHVSPLPNNCYSLSEFPTGWLFVKVESVDGLIEKKNIYKQ